MSSRSLSPPREPVMFILGILGTREKISEQDLIEQLMLPIVQELGRLPDRVLVPAEGISSIYIQQWAESLHIPYQAFEADWRSNKRSAVILRDARIQKECTHALIFLSPRSTRYEETGERMATSVKARKTVFTASYPQNEIVLLEPVPPPSPSLGGKASSPAARARKSDSGKAQPCQPVQTLLDFGIPSRP